MIGVTLVRGLVDLVVVVHVRRTVEEPVREVGAEDAADVVVDRRRRNLLRRQGDVHLGR
jgi:hypothetical protein